MDAAAAEESLREFLVWRKVSDSTRSQYAHNIRRFISWCDSKGLPVNEAKAHHIADFLAESSHLSDATVVLRALSVRYFFDYLAAINVVATNPAQSFGSQRAKPITRDVLSIEELSSLWMAATRLQDRVIIGLLGICGVRLSELISARVGDLKWRENVLVMSLPDRTGPHEFDHVAIPPNVASDLVELIGKRRDGPLLIPNRGTSVTPRAIRLAIDRVSKNLSIGFRVTSRTLTFTLRSIAIENAFPYASVVSSVSEIEPRRLAEWVRRIHIPYEEHASYRMGRMIAASRDRDEASLVQAEFLLGDRGQSPVAGLLVAAATLERSLRESVDAAGIIVTKRDPTLSTYATLLRGQSRISLSDLRTIERILTFRNDAAHGWFDRVTRDDAEWVLKQTRILLGKVPVS